MADFDFIVIGGGSAGFHAARVAAEQEKRTALIEGAPDFGGLCILRGCMPTKTLLRTAEVARLIREAGELAIKVPPPIVDWNGLVARKDRLVEDFASHRRMAAEGLPNVEIVRGQARFESPNSVRVGDSVLTAGKLAIATGSVPWRPNAPGLEEVGCITSDEAQVLPSLPGSLLVFGGGAVAVEFAQLFHRLGVEVTVVQRSPLVLSKMDPDISRSARECLEDEGIRFVTGARVERFEKADGLKSCIARTSSGTMRVSAEEILCAAGRRPAVERLDCDAGGVRCHDGWVTVDENMRTSNPHILAAGDVVGGPSIGVRQLVHVAVKQGEIAGHNAFNEPLKSFNRDLVPEAVFTDPAIGAVGMTQPRAEATGRPIVTAISRFEDLGKAITMNEIRGLAKMIADAETGKIMGVHIMGPGGADLIHECVVAMYYGATVQEFGEIPHLHPTLAEILVDPAEELAHQIGQRRSA